MGRKGAVSGRSGPFPAIGRTFPEPDLHHASAPSRPVLGSLGGLGGKRAFAAAWTNARDAKEADAQNERPKTQRGLMFSPIRHKLSQRGPLYRRGLNASFPFVEAPFSSASLDIFAAAVRLWGAQDD